MDKQERQKEFTSLIGQSVRNARKYRGKTQKEMAEKLGIKQSTYSAYENGARKWSLEMFVKVSNILAMSIEHILDHAVNFETEEYKEACRKLVEQSSLDEGEIIISAFEAEMANLQSRDENLADAPALQWAQIGIDISRNINENGQQLIKSYIDAIMQNPVMQKS